MFSTSELKTRGGRRNLQSMMKGILYVQYTVWEFSLDPSPRKDSELRLTSSPQFQFGPIPEYLIDGYRYLQSRKKGMLTSKDAYKRLKFARQMKRLSPYFWKRYVRFYFDGKSFVDKTNPYDQARTVKLRAWRRRNEGLVLHCTSKGKKAEVKGKVVHFYFLPIACKKGVICCDKYTERLNGEFYESYIRKSFPKHFQASANPKAMHFLHDGDLSQNSAVAQKAMSDVDALLLRISARSPDFNPIVRIFSSSCQRCSIKKRCS